jgi:hypothetical protein
VVVFRQALVAHLSSRALRQAFVARLGGRISSGFGGSPDLCVS